ncbi:hypothetical protein [Enterobacter oligotrophicus]|uniref:hypothetical protein n=1 Tax=Enterobacter oligotrophicus TaxID=2478464 RepID=UPI001CEDC87A|nr:hypothetical protein [Enterobacter oligotrophicus]
MENEKRQALRTDLLIANALETAKQLRELQESPVAEAIFESIVENENGKEIQFERPISDLAFAATWQLERLVEAMESAEQQNAANFQIKARLCRESNSLHDRLREAEKRIAELERSETQLIDERDNAESALNDAYKAVMGQAPEWSNWFSFADAIDEIELACGLWRNQTEDVIQFRARIAELEARTLSQAATDVLAERRRQVTSEGWTPEHDDQYDDGELIDAAACYAQDSSLWDCVGEPPSDWPWSDEWWKPSKNMRRNLIKAGALILAEIERRDRAAGTGKGE